MSAPETATTMQEAATESTGIRATSRASTRHQDRYGAVLVLIVLTLLAVAVAGTSWWSRVLPLTVEGAALVFTLWTSAVRRPVLLLAGAVVVVALISASVSAAYSDGAADWESLAVGALLALVAPVAILRRLARHDRVQLSTLFGAMCLYLTIGLFFAFVFGAIGDVDHGQFFAHLAHARSIDYLYFSFVTLTTVGYGDLTPLGDLGRMLAVTEALSGQLYLVSVVALLVSNVGHARPVRRSPEGLSAGERQGD